MKNWIRQILEFGMADLFNDKPTGMASEDVVCAGDPANSPESGNGLLKLNPEIVGNKIQKRVDGYSQSPRGIDDGDNILMSPIDATKDPVREGDFLIVKVDPDYYEDEKPRFKYKMRCAIMIIEEDWTEDDIINRLKTMDSQPEIWLGYFQKNLRRKFQKARGHYPTGRLMLSTTYKNGVLQYSFHKPEFIIYRADVLIKEDDPDTLIPLPIAA